MIHIFVQFKDCGIVAHSVRIVGRAEHRHALVAVRPVESILCDLMRSCNVVEPIPVIELAGEIFTEEVAGAT